jgi:hypothetical protein
VANPSTPVDSLRPTPSVLLGSVVKVEDLALGKSARQRLRSLCGRSEPQPFTSTSAAQKIGIAWQGVCAPASAPIKVPRDADGDRCIR